MSQISSYLISEKKHRITSRVISGAIYAALGLWALLVLFPFYWMLLSSVKTFASYNAEHIPKFFTLSPTLENYLQAFTEVPLASYFLNTLIYTVVTTALMVIVSTLAAFAFAMISASLLFVSGLGLDFAATAISLPSFVKILPFAASALPFFACMLCHLLCPDISFLLN